MPHHVIGLPLHFIVLLLMEIW